jgi:hypothetical protein
LFQHITSYGADTSGLLIEQLRYAGLLKVVRETEIDNHDGTYSTAYMLEVNCPHGLDDEVWARQNAERMRSFGINAQDPWRS